MRILVVSDTHGDFSSFNRVVLSQPTAEVIFHLGDGEEQAEDIRLAYPEKMVISVRGNCDWGSMKNSLEIITIESKKIMAAHGHLYNVKMGTEEIIAAAKEQCADILLYGHTHNPSTVYKHGLYVMNPGSLHGSWGTYGIVDITPAGIVTDIRKMR